MRSAVGVVDHLIGMTPASTPAKLVAKMKYTAIPARATSCIFMAATVTDRHGGPGAGK
jgi:hypothetical protein